MNWQGPEDYKYRAMRHGSYATFYDNAMPALDPLKELGPAPWLGPWLEGKDPDVAAGAGFLSPNFTTFVRAFSMAQIIIWPVSPSQTRVCQFASAPEHYFDEPDVAERIKPVEDLMEVIIEEDRPMIESLQRVMGKQAFRPGRMSTGEMLVHHYINSYLDRIADVLPAR